MRIRLGIAGFRHGHVASLVKRAQERRDIVELVAIAEDDDTIRQEWAARLGVPAYADYHDMLAKERLDAVGVAAVNGRRARIIADSLNAGKHVITDKPLATRLEDLAEVEAAWRKSGRMLSMMLDKRFYQPTLAFREVLERGAIGDLTMAWASGPHRLRRATRPDWMFQRESYGGIINDIAIHDIDLLLSFAGARSGSVQGLVGNRGNVDLPEFEDHGMALLRLDTGLMASIEVHWMTPEASPFHGDYRMVITGTRGTAELQFARNELILVTDTEPPHSVSLPPLQYVEDDFFQAVIAEREQALRTEEILTATRVALLAQENANTGQWFKWAP